MRNHSRRDFFKVISSGAGLVTASTASTVSASEEMAVDNEELGMLYDATKCVGCKACMSACKRVNGDSGSLSPDTAKFDKDALWDAPEDLSGNTRTIIKLYKEKQDWSYIKYSCMHCQKPSCVSVCPVSAMTKDELTGIVDYNKDTCIGCRYCQIACPFNIPRFQWDRALPQIVKCDLCRNTNLKVNGITACAEVCPTGAILYGKRKDLLQEAKTRLLLNPKKYVQKVYGEHEVGGTNHLILTAMPFEKLGLPALKPEAPMEFAEKVQHTIYKGFIAPVALYGVLCFIAVQNMKKHEHHEQPAEQPPAEGKK